MAGAPCGDITPFGAASATVAPTDTCYSVTGGANFQQAQCANGQLSVVLYRDAYCQQRVVSGGGQLYARKRPSSSHFSSRPCALSAFA